MALNKGDIHLVNFDPVKVGEMSKLRPAIILSDNQDITLFSTVVVVPLSSVVIDDNMPYRFLINKRDKLKKDSDACIYEIRALLKSRVKDKVASISDDELNDIRQALCDLL
ncbi:hypothetical protein SPBRAN_1897 [uncultured Candidatus Thioglobus sp.]|nr:hypothetical protein SPBRAN_1897 [uncultured Candidatus Thioglobus sp.]